MFARLVRYVEVCMNDETLYPRLRNKIFALEQQNKAFFVRIRNFKDAPLWRRLVIALKGEL